VMVAPVTARDTSCAPRPKTATPFPSRCWWRVRFSISTTQLSRSTLMANDETHTLIEWHLKNNHNLEHCVFRVAGDRKFAEGAICPKCNSSCITYDISKKLLREMMKDAEKYMVDDHPDDNLEQIL
ncbi:MAG: hypothetical protein R6U21_00380, partial [Thermoplasmatota archaeon]